MNEEKTFDEKLIDILEKSTYPRMSEQQISEAMLEIKQLISEVIGERKSVDELTIPDAMTDLASKVCFKEGYNTKREQLRHAFNLKGE